MVRSLTNLKCYEYLANSDTYPRVGLILGSDSGICKYESCKRDII